MKPILKITAFVLMAGVLFHISCKKEYSCEGCIGDNKPPIANAGDDQTILLPTDSVTLDGSTSHDPDGTISNFQWTKISGPASFAINSTAAARTVVKSLAAGVYQFELKVTDNGGLSAKDTILVIVSDPTQPNRPPVANAGSDQTLTLPANSVTLNGSGSTDPDNNITGYSWIKVSGPSSFTIANSNVVQTQATNLVQGTYQFELKVTDAGGLFSKDTVRIAVNAVPPPPPPGCNVGNRPLVNAQLISIGTISQSRYRIAVASVGNKVLFAGGNLPDGMFGAGSTRVDIYDWVTNTWSTAELSQGRGGMATTVLGNKIFFGGGYKDGNRTSSRVDIYDGTINTWSTGELSLDRTEMAAAAAGNKVVFAGGVHAEDGYWFGGTTFTDRVDIYDASSNTWTVSSLSENMRVGMSAVTVGSKIYFAGGTGNWGVYDGNPTSKIDIYDAATNLWSTSSLITARGWLAGIAVNNKIYWAGGEIYQVNPESFAEVEIRDVSTVNTSLGCLFQPNSYFSAAMKNNKIVFFTGRGIQQNKFDIFDTIADSWSIGVLPVDIDGSSIISVNNTIYVAGGYMNGVLSNQVWKLEF